MDWSMGMFFGVPLWVWEKNMYVLLGISSSIGTSLIPKMTSAEEISSAICAPAYVKESEEALVASFQS